MPRLPHSAAGLALLLLTQASPAAADDYDDAVTGARRAASSGELDEAARLWGAAASAWPQDFTLAAELGALELSREHLVEAEAAWRAALARSPKAPAAHLGLALTLSRLARCDEAEAEARLAQAPDAVKGCRAPAPPAPLKASLSVTGSELVFSNRTATGVSASLDVPYAGNWSFGGTARYLQLFDSRGTATSGQEEVYLRAGWGTAAFGLSLAGALTNDESRTVGQVKHLGFAARASFWGDLILSGTVSFSTSAAALGRAELTWRLPLGRSFSVTPGFAGQYSSGTWYATPSLAVAFTHPRVSAWLGFRYGEELKPTWLMSGLSYQLSESVLWGGHAGVRVELAGPLAVQAGYSLDRLSPAAGSSSGTFLHAFTVGPVFRF